MILDQQNMFTGASGDSPTATGSTASTNVIDLGVSRDIGGAVTDPLFLLCQVIMPFTSGGSATLQVQLQTSPDNATWSILEQSDAIAVASLVQGYRFLEGRMASTTQRYLRLNYVIGTAVMTAGTIEAALTAAISHHPAYPRGYAA